MTARAADSLQLGFAALDETASRADHQAQIAALVPLAQELAKARPRGVTISDLRHEAVRRGLLPATAAGRALSFLGYVFKAAKLVTTEEFRRSDVDASHGNPHRVWVLP